MGNNKYPSSYSIHMDSLDKDVTVYPMFNKQDVLSIDKNSDEFWNRFACLVEQFIEEHPRRGVIILPVDCKLNHTVSKRISNIIDKYDIKTSKGGLYTISVDDVLDVLYSYQRSDNYLIDKAIESLTKIDIVDDGYVSYRIFDYHYISDYGVRNEVFCALNSHDNDDFVVMYNKNINYRDILLIDSDISDGQSASEAIDAISITYRPKSVSVVTLY